MFEFVKQMTRTALRKMGYELRSFNPNSSKIAQLIYSLNHFGIDCVLDIGANTGQFASAIRQNGFKHQIVSFEPLTSAHDLLSRAAANAHKWEVYERCAMGDRAGKSKINIAANSVSSSLLPMMQSHSNAAPNSSYIGLETVPLKTIDSIFPVYFKKFSNIFLKIDAQGFETQILAGSLGSLPKIKGVLLEISLVSLYEGQELWEDILLRMKSAGFVLWAIQPGFTDGQNGRTYQVDGIFFAKWALKNSSSVDTHV